MKNAMASTVKVRSSQRALACHGRQPNDLSPRTRDQLKALAETAYLFGEDFDGFAAFLEDVLLIY